jgi:hypothetical protein
LSLPSFATVVVSSPWIRHFLPLTAQVKQF